MVISLSFYEKREAGRANWISQEGFSDPNQQVLQLDCPVDGYSKTILSCSVSMWFI